MAVPEGSGVSSEELVPALGRGRTSLFCHVCQQQRLKPSHSDLEKSGSQTSGSIEVWSGCQNKQHIEGWLAWAHRGAGGVHVHSSGSWSWHPVPQGGALARLEDGFKQDHEK